MLNILLNGLLDFASNVCNLWWLFLLCLVFLYLKI